MEVKAYDTYFIFVKRSKPFVHVPQLAVQNGPDLFNVVYVSVNNFYIGCGHARIVSDCWQELGAALLACA